MGCKSCSSGSCGTKNKEDGTKVGGCQNNGACSSGGCNKMNVFDWLSNMDVPTFSKFNIVEVKFKGGRKEFFRNTNQVELYAGDPVIVDVPSGHHLGFVSLQGELVRLQMLKKSIKDNDEIKAIYRKANDKDLEKHEQAVARDYPTMYRTREIIKELKLNMKLSDVEFQSDNTKAIFYYSSDDRVDFRELIKTLAGEFKVRIEMKQISLRQEAARVGGIGVCGRELCCSTWLTDFKNVTTSAARYQNLSLNPVKLSGQCGRLKCCLNYELETYMDALKDIPTIEKPLQTLKGDAFLQKTDIFKRVMWFGYRGEESNWIPVSVDRVREILNMNESGQKPQTIDGAESAKIELELEKGSGPLNADLDKMDKKYGGGNKKKFDRNKSDRPDFKQERTNSQRPERKDFKKDNPRPERKDFKQEKRDIKPDNNKSQNTEKPVNQAVNKPQAEQPNGQKGNNQQRPQGQKGNKQQNPRPHNQQVNGEGQQPKPQNQQRQQGNGEGQQPKPQNQQRQQNSGEGQQPKPQNQQRQQGNGEGQQPKPQNQQRQQGNGEGQQPKPQNQQRPQNNKQQGNKPQQNQPRPQNQPNGGNKGPKPNNRPPENKSDGQA
ncbi:regulatory iron-sulfur-containing complex subunit RicT [Arcicella sp. LKC2W]|uniref:regulatory iron-sulfur-containing complex subunit RicT n=1 Tax=Arcicella sp. LKC2W TaxID=2984198 RepID=UPI002B2068A4|nr:regulatory iron-sulfur-containing complex subunit RicT [Arcicella sp. LKC2W]MEA5458332.1 regulatory iron-sulfur-containing complex subunit RicT [Arcicella sp. LKC2W]